MFSVHLSIAILWKDQPSYFKFGPKVGTRKYFCKCALIHPKALLRPSEQDLTGMTWFHSLFNIILFGTIFFLPYCTIRSLLVVVSHPFWHPKVEHMICKPPQSRVFHSRLGSQGKHLSTKQSEHHSNSIPRHRVIQMSWEQILLHNLRTTSGETLGKSDQKIHPH